MLIRPFVIVDHWSCFYGKTSSTLIAARKVSAYLVK